MGYVLDTEMNMLDELTLLLNKVTTSEDLVQRADAWFRQNQDLWSHEVAAYFQDLLARKRDQIAYEWDRVNVMGREIALTYDPDDPESWSSVLDRLIDI